MIDPLFGAAIAIALACLLLSAAWHKVAAAAAFVATLDDYRLLPRRLVKPVAALLPAAEAALAVGWLAGGRSRGVAVTTAALLLMYGGALAVNLLRGRRQIDCGCGLSGAAGGEQPLSWWLVARNVVLASLAGIAALPDSGRALGTPDFLTLAAATLAAVLLYAGASQLIRNAALGARRVPRG
jgi:hypothetical protein